MVIATQRELTFLRQQQDVKDTTEQKVETIGAYDASTSLQRMRRQCRVLRRV